MINSDYSDYWEQFLAPGEALRKDWNTKEAFDAFVKRFPGKIPRLNETKILNNKDTYGMKGFHA